jgi:hypothetical protein
MKKYFWNLLVAIDQLVNTILLGDPDETVSSRMGKAKRNGNKFAIMVCKFLSKFDNKHCIKSIEEDEGKDGYT